MQQNTIFVLHEISVLTELICSIIWQRYPHQTPNLTVASTQIDRPMWSYDSKKWGSSSQSLNRIIKKTKRELVFYWCIIALSFTRPIVFHKVRPILHLLSFHKVRLEPSSRRSSFPTDFGQPTSLGYGFARCWIGTLGSFPWLWFHWILDRDSGISLIYSSMSLIRWRGIWLPYESHSYSSRLLAFRWISSLWDSEHRADNCSALIKHSDSPWLCQF